MLSSTLAERLGRHVLYEADLDGIFYPTRHHNGLHAVAVFDRARRKLAFHIPWSGVLGNRDVPSLWAEVAPILRRFAIDLP